ncbi:MAG: YfcE family phosphodiesterase [Ruminiclostridium sp.]|nr:YfcE family phosphodiesterase [Ruminiclostridium sp.]
MDITVISDTHGDFETLYEIVSRNEASDLFIHLGDGEQEFADVRSAFYTKAFLFVKGNNDWDDHPQNIVTELGGVRFYMCHGHRFPRAQLSDFLSATAVANECRVALFGHTHVAVNENVNGVLLFNPGSTTLPRGGVPPTYGRITIDSDGNVNAVHIPIDF